MGTAPGVGKDGRPGGKAGGALIAVDGNIGSGANALLLTCSAKLYKRVKAKIGHVKNVKLHLAENAQEIIAMTDRQAPEHVEVLTRDAVSLSKKITNAGAIFAGAYSPTATGDYLAGPSHVLPTGRTARFASGLSSADFVKRSSLISCTRQALQKNAKDIIALSRADVQHGHITAPWLRSAEKNVSS